jgi:DNA polymerase III sliding clamp (beta) subunit (PCNA family)
MKTVVINREALAVALKICIPIAAKSTRTQSILLNVMRDSVTLEAINDTTAVMYQIAAESSYTGCVMLSPKILKALQAEHGEQVFIQQADGQNISVRIADDRWEFPTEDPNDYSSANWSNDCVASVPAVELLQALKFVEHAVDKDNASNRYALGGVYFEFHWGSKCLVQTTNGKQIAFTQTALNAEGKTEKTGKRGIVVPLDCIKTIRTLCSRAELVEVFEVGEQIQFQAGGMRVVTKLLEGRFPNVKATTCRGEPFAAIQSDILQNAVKAAAVVTDAQDSAVDLKFRRDGSPGMALDDPPFLHAMSVSPIGKSVGYGWCLMVTEDRQLTIAAELLLESIKSLPEDLRLDLRTDDSEKLQINCEHGTIVIAGMSRNEPKKPSVQDDSKPVPDPAA